MAPWLGCERTKGGLAACQPCLEHERRARNAMCVRVYQLKVIALLFEHQASLILLYLDDASSFILGETRGH